MKATAVALSGAAILIGLAVVPASAQETCSTYRATCEAVCTPERAIRYYAGSMRRCTASCEPRWQQCIRTGFWADLEYRYSGWWERASGW